MPGHWPEGNVCTANYCRARRGLVTASQGQHAHFPLRAGLLSPELPVIPGLSGSAEARSQTALG